MFQRLACAFTSASTLFTTSTARPCSLSSSSSSSASRFLLGQVSHLHRLGYYKAQSLAAFSSTGYRPRLVSETKQQNTTKMSAQSQNQVSVSISSAFDGGNGEFIKSEVVDGQTVVHIAIRKDPYTALEKVQHFQYFSFRSTLGSDSFHGPSSIKYILANAGKASYPRAWKDTTVFTSTTPHDPYSWTRILHTDYDDSTGHLYFTYDHLRPGSTYFAYFPPYSYERHMSLISRCSDRAGAGAGADDDDIPQCRVDSLGKTLDGREMECVVVGSGSLKCWIIHRQHPGETMAEFYAEGLLNRLLALDNGGSVDGKVKEAQQIFTFYIVPNMCPDGGVRGHLRTNAQGQNLNREWTSTGQPGTPDYYEAPTLERSPEVYHVLRHMDATGVDVFLDIHGDEELPVNFLSGAQGVSNWGPRLQALHGLLVASYSRANSDMQALVAYDPCPQGKARLNLCTNQIAARFDCLAATLEMPFKDCITHPDPKRGWSPARAMKLGASVLDALVYVSPQLRAKDEWWDQVREEDRYVNPSSKYK